jgi:DNA-binding transcriptional ArsR family regulator
MSYAKTSSKKSSQREPKKSRKGATSLYRIAQGLKTTADPTRIRILLSLSKGEKSVQAVVTELKTEQPAISHHLALLRMSKLVVPRREGSRNLYKLTPLGSDHVLTLRTLMSTPRRSRQGAKRRPKEAITMTTFDLAAVRSFGADLDAQMDRCEKGQRDGLRHAGRRPQPLR